MVTCCGVSILLERLLLRRRSPAINSDRVGALGVGIELGLGPDSQLVLLVARVEGRLPLLVLAILPWDELGTRGGVGSVLTLGGLSKGGGPPCDGGRSALDPGRPERPLSTAALAS